MASELAAQKHRVGGTKTILGVVPHVCSVSDVVAHLKGVENMVGEVVGARGALLGGPYGAAKAHCCVAVDESRSSLAARCVSFTYVISYGRMTAVTPPPIPTQDLDEAGSPARRAQSADGVSRRCSS